MTQTEIIRKINLALDLLYEKDARLIEINVHERSIAHKFAEYLQLLFPEYNVDCEYDKHGKYTKRLEGIKECDEERLTNRILPDIIIHERAHDSRNLAVFEIKSKSEATVCDIKKLELMTSQNGEFRYRFGIFIRFQNTRSDCEITLYANSKDRK